MLRADHSLGIRWLRQQAFQGPPIAASCHETLRRVKGLRAAACLQGLTMKYVRMEPYTLHPLSLAHAMPGIAADTSAAVYKDLQAAHLIDRAGWGRFPAYNDEEHVYVATWHPEIA